MSKENNLSAFPVTVGDQVFSNGMLLRDYFAGQFLAGIMADPTCDGRSDHIAEDAYAFADEMLNAREK